MTFFLWNARLAPARFYLGTRGKNLLLPLLGCSDGNNNDWQKPKKLMPTCNAHRFLSTETETGEGKIKHIYVHPLSQIVLECLQSNYSEWLVRRQLHRNSLTFYRDGSFKIFKNKSGLDDNGISYCIWTSFDEHEKKHWLMVRRGKLIGRYLLVDNLTTWNQKGSLPSRIQHAVNEMVESIEDLERKKMF